MIAASRRRSRAIVPGPAWITVSIACILSIAGCSRENAIATRATWLGTDADPIVIVVGVVDLRTPQYDSLPRLSAVLDDGAQWEDVLSAGAGSAAALALIDGRAPLDHLRVPGDVFVAARNAGWDVDVIEVAATLRSEPEWVDAGLAAAAVRSARSDLPVLGDLPDGRVWRVLLVDPFSRDEHPLLPRAGEQDPAGLSWLDDALASWIDSLRSGPYADRIHVVLTGIPRAPARDQRARAMPGSGTMPDALQVPWVWCAPRQRSTTAERVSTPVLAHEQIARSLGRSFTPAAQRWSAWWSDHSGGLYVELPARDDLAAARAWIDERPHWTPVADQVERDLLGQRAAEFDAAALALSFGAPPRLWCAVRGSEELDFVDLSFVADGIDSVFTGWALEDIDLVRTDTARVRTLALAAEPRADGAIVELGWPPRPVELRVRGEMTQAPVLGVGFHAGAPAKTVGLGGLRLSPFTRTFWRAAAGGWPITADGWWEDATVGVHLGISASATVPREAVWVD